VSEPVANGAAPVEDRSDVVLGHLGKALRRFAGECRDRDGEAQDTCREDEEEDGVTFQAR
jgi:hypothetical protein